MPITSITVISGLNTLRYVKHHGFDCLIVFFPPPTPQPCLNHNNAFFGSFVFVGAQTEHLEYHQLGRRRSSPCCGIEVEGKEVHAGRQAAE